MDVSKRNLITGLVGIVLLLIGVLVYAQVTASHNFELGEYQQQTE
jgi:formate hydrogenlyase subunit 3/multisubunit Na+/H+ antiporter MnhD subunit